MLFAERIVGRMLDQGQRSAVMLQGRLNGCLAAFAEVDDRVELWEVRRSKRNKLYRNVTTRAWLTGYYIVEYEQQGADRAKYGVMRKARRCLAFLYSVGEDAVEVMTWYDSSAAA